MADLTVKSQVGWDTLQRYVDTFDQGLELGIDEDAHAAAADLIADVLHALARFTAQPDPEDTVNTALMHYRAES